MLSFGRQDTALQGGGAVHAGSHTAEPGVVPALVVCLAAIAGITYASFLLESFLSPNLDVVDGYVSELSAIDQPYNLVYSTGDFVTGVLSATVAAIALMTLSRRPWAVVGWTSLLLFGICAIGDATFPLDCAPSLETGCALRERAEQVSFSHEFHAVTSSAVITTGTIALLALSIAARRYGWWPALARWGWLVAVTEAVFAIATLGLMLTTGTWLGLAQRIQIGVLCLGLLIIAWALFADRTRRHLYVPSAVVAPVTGHRSRGHASGAWR
jgi:hypothetical membrane protein